VVSKLIEVGEFGEEFSIFLEVLRKAPKNSRRVAFCGFPKYKSEMLYT
jgi:hypothetical protein